MSLPAYQSPWDQASLVAAAAAVATLAANAQPAWSGVDNTGPVIQSTVAEHVVDARAVPAGSLKASDLVEATVEVFVAGTADLKKVRICIDGDITNSLLVSLAANQVGVVRIVANFFIKAASPHLSTTTATLAGAALSQARGTVTVDLGANAVNLQTRAWVANAADSITVDSISWRLVRTGA